MFKLSSALASRVVTALIGVPLLVVLFNWGAQWLLTIAVAIAGAISVFEMAMMLVPPLQAIGQPLDSIKTARRGAAVSLPLIAAIVTALFFFAYARQPQLYVIVLIMVALMLTAVLLPGTIDRKLGSLVALIVSFSWAALPWVCVWQMFHRHDHPQGVILLLTLVWICDTVAYFAGRAFGKRPLAKTLSPKKTLEGTLCSLVGGAVVVSAFAPFMSWNVGWWVYPLIGIIGAVLVALGDLLESLVKRFARVDDSGSILPGHGGLLDCTDGVLTVAPALLLWLQYV